MIKIIQHFEWYYQNQYITARDGNACVRLDDGNFLVTASGVQKNELDSRSYVIVNTKGEVVEAPYNQTPSIETKAHLAVLSRSGKKASVHVHSMNTVALAYLFDRENQTDFSPDVNNLVNVLRTKWPELFRYTKVAAIPPFFPPGSNKLHSSIDACMSYWDLDYSDEENVEEKELFYDIVILQRHGVLATGDSLDQCREHIERLEHVSEMLLKIIAASGGRLESIL